MSRKVLTNWDLNGNQLLNVVIQNLGTDPPSPAAGQLWYNSATNQLKYFDGTTVHILAAKDYVDGSVQGLQIKPTATVATTGALPTYAYNNGTAGAGATWTFTATGAVTVDGHPLALNDLVLIKDESSEQYNGLALVTTAPATAVNGVLTRSVDMQTASQMSGAFVPVGAIGTANKNSIWLCNPSGTVTVGTTALPFTQLNAATSFSDGTGITISGNTISISATYAGQSTITTVGALAAGSLASGFTPITIPLGGTGGDTVASAKSSLGFSQIYNTTLTGDGSTSTFTVTHDLNNATPTCQVNDSSGNLVEADIQSTGANTLTVKMTPVLASGATVNVVVTG